jgi:hypothetical protein
MVGFDMPSALLCPARFCTPDVVGGVVILLSMSYLVYGNVIIILPHEVLTAMCFVYGALCGCLPPTNETNF